MEDRKLLVAVAAIALAGVLGLFMYSSTIEPLTLDIGDINESHVGKVVTTRGTVTRAGEVAGGSISATLADLNSSATISVFLPAGSSEGILPGAVIEVQGEVTMYQDELEVSVARAEDVRVIAEASAAVFDLPVLMGSIGMFDGAELTVRGTLADLEAIYSNGTLVGTSFTLVNETGNGSYELSCMCFGRDLTASFADWQDVTVTGGISFYENRACWQMVAEVVATADAR